MENYNILKQLSFAHSQSGGTSLLSYFIPNCSQEGINNAITKLNQELGIGNNIKSKSVKKDIISALKSAIYHLKNYKNFDNDNGIVLFSGRVTGNQYCL
jgi:peptide subunit release factor 1 (eRF1)